MRNKSALSDALTSLRRCGWRNVLGWWNLLYISHLDGAAFPGRQDLLDSLTKQTIPLRDPVAAPSEEEIQLNGLYLHVGTVVFWKGRHLRREADTILTNPPSQLVQSQTLKLL